MFSDLDIKSTKDESHSLGRLNASIELSNKYSFQKEKFKADLLLVCWYKYISTQFHNYHKDIPSDRSEQPDIDESDMCDTELRSLVKGQFIKLFYLNYECNK